MEAVPVYTITDSDDDKERKPMKKRRIVSPLRVYDKNIEKVCNGSIISDYFGRYIVIFL